MKRVLITGANGFLGRHCLTELVARGADVHAVTRGALPFAGPAGVQMHHADLLDPQQGEALLNRVRPTHLLHLAWITTPGQYWTSSANLQWAAAGKLLFWAFAARAGMRIVAAGSCAEYDPTAGICREGDTSLRPASIYGAAKAALAADLDGLASVSNVSVAWARLFFLYGPHEHPARLVPSVTRAMLEGNPATCSAGDQRRDFLHVQDAARALVRLLESDVRGAVNIGSGTATPVQEVTTTLGAITGRADLLRPGARSASLDEPPLLVADTARLRHEVGWTPQIPLTVGLSQTVAWWRKEIGEFAKAA
jgi:nucleoside-diphosphate-sugar epimerase